MCIRDSAGAGYHLHRQADSTAHTDPNDLPCQPCLRRQRQGLDCGLYRLSLIHI